MSERDQPIDLFGTGGVIPPAARHTSAPTRRAPASERRVRKTARSVAPAQDESTPSETGEWSWDDGERAVGYRIPEQLAAMWEARTKRLELPVAIAATVAIDRLLKLDDEQLVALVAAEYERKPRRMRRGAA